MARKQTYYIAVDDEDRNIYYEPVEGYRVVIPGYEEYHFSETR